MEQRSARRPIAFIAGPYSTDSDALRLENIWHAWKCAAMLWSEGFTVICPHTNSAMMSGVVDEEAFNLGYLDLLSFADLLVLVPGHEQSFGSQVECKVAESRRIPILFWNGSNAKQIRDEYERLTK